MPATVSPTAQASTSHKTEMSSHPEPDLWTRPHQCWKMPDSSEWTSIGGRWACSSRRGLQAEVIYLACGFRETFFYLISSWDTRAQRFTPHFLPWALIYLLAVPATKISPSWGTRVISVKSESIGPDGPGETILATGCGPFPGLQQTHVGGVFTEALEASKCKWFP